MDAFNRFTPIFIRFTVLTVLIRFFPFQPFNRFTLDILRIPYGCF